MQETIFKLETLTKHFTGFNLNICLSYGGRAEITQACTRVASDVLAGKLSLSSISELLFSSYLSSASIPGIYYLIVIYHNFFSVVVIGIVIMCLYRSRSFDSNFRRKSALELFMLATCIHRTTFCSQNVA